MSVWLRRGLESIAESSGMGIEVVIRDDSDMNQGRAIAAEIFETWLGVWRYEYHEQPLGMAQNWNRSIQWATGKHVMVLHDDGFWVSGGIGFGWWRGYGNPAIAIQCCYLGYR